MPDRWRLGSHNPYTVYRVADGAHDVEHGGYFLGSFRREEDARLAVDAVNAMGQAVSLNVLEGRSRYVARMLGDAVEDDDVPRWNDLMARVRRLASQPTTPPSCDCPGTDGADPAGSADDEWVDDPSRSDHPVYECNLDHWCAMCGDPASHKVGEEAPTRVPDNTNDVMIAVGHNLTNWLCCLHFRSVIGDCGDRRTGDDRVNARRDDPDRTMLPAGSAVGQRGAPTRDARGEAEAVAKAFGRLCGGDDGASWDDEEEIAVPREWVRRAYRLALAALRDGEADTGGERAVPTLTMVAPFADCGFCGAPLADLCAPLPDGTMACSARCVDLSRIARALGVSLDPDDPDPVGRLVEAAGKAREVEVVSGDEMPALLPGSIVVACYSDGSPAVAPLPGEAAYEPRVVGVGPKLHPVARYRVLYRAPVPAPAALAVGDEVTTAEQLETLPVGTALRDRQGDVVKVGTATGRGPQLWAAGDPEALHWRAVLPARVIDLPAVRVGTGGSDSS